MALNLGELYGKLSLDNKEWNKALDGAEQGLKDLGSKGKMIAGAAGVAVGAALAAGLVKAFNVEAANDKLAASLGLTKKQSEQAGKTAGKVFANGYGESIEEVNGAVGAVMSSIKGLRNGSAKDIEAMTTRVLDMSAAFEIDTTRAAQVAGQMIETGFAKNGIEAADLLTAALQKVPTALREDLIDAVDEYGPAFQQLGIGGEKAMGMLVEGSKKGMYGIDKTGDAVKEFAIRATDMSKTTGEAYDILGMDQTKMTNALLAGGDKGAAAFQKIVGGLQDIKDPSERSQAALALFGTPLEDLSTKDIPKFLGSLTNTETGMGKVAGASKKMGDTLNDNASTNIQTFSRRLQQAFVKVLGEKVIPAINTAVKWINANMVPAFKRAAKWVQENKQLLTFLAFAIGGAVAALLTFKIVLTVAKWLKMAKLAVLALNAAMRANPIGLIITAIGLLVGALVWLYNNNKTAKRIIDAAWDGIKKAVKWAWEKVIRPAFQAIWRFIKNDLIPIIQWLWKNIIKPAFKGIGAIIKWAWEKLIKPAFKAIWGFIKNDLAPFVTWLWKKIIKPAFKGIGNAIEWAWDNVIKPVFETLKKFITKTIPNAFDKGVKKIKDFWEGLKKIAKAPIKFMIDTVYNKGIRSVFNNVMDFVGSDKRLPKLQVKGFRKGGYTGTMGRDQAAGVVHGQEWVVPAEATAQIRRTHPGLLEGMTAQGAAALPPIPGYKKGGFVWPVSKSYPITQNPSAAHPAYDIGTPVGTPVKAAASGRVTKAGPGYRAPGVWGGTEAWIGHGGVASLYAHLSQLLVGVGDRVKQGQTIARSGNTGISSGPHLHFGAFQNGAMVSPQPWLGGKGVGGVGGGGFNPLGWLLDNGMKLLSGFMDKIPGSGAFVDIAKEIAKSVVGSIKDWALGAVGGEDERDKKTSSGSYKFGNAAPPTLYDNGGYLKTGPTLVQNNTGKPEAVLTNEELQMFKAAALNGGMPEKVILEVGGEQFPAYVRREAVNATGGALTRAEDRLKWGGKHNKAEVFA